MWLVDCFLVLYCFCVVFIGCNDALMNANNGPDTYNMGNENGNANFECHDIKSKICNNLPYNRTLFPNILGHVQQEEADREALNFQPLITVGCSKTLKLFLCVMYFPVCNILGKQLRPCQSLCEENRNGCTPIMRRFGFQWPESMDCTKFSTATQDPLCIRHNSSDSPNGNSNQNSPSASLFRCPLPLQTPRDLKYTVKIDNEVVHNCGLPCNSTLFPDSSKREFARHWVGIWAIMGTFFTLISIITFLLDRDRFSYPERPFLYLICCYFVISCIYTVGYGLGERVACSDVKNADFSGQTESLITQGTSHSTLCTILFMLNYFFSTAASIWWLILCFTWFLAAGLTWAQESISHLSQYFHFFAWGLPAALTITLLILGRMSGDPISGICTAGAFDREVLLGFIIIPQALLLLLGAGLLLFGFINLFNIRKFVKANSRCSRTEKFEKLIVRIGFLGCFYIFPAVFVLIINVYELVEQDQWLITWWAKNCVRYKIQCPNPTNMMEMEGLQDITRQLAEASLESGSRADQGLEPKFELIMIKYLMLLIVGISYSLWVWSRKTLKAWVRLFQGRCLERSDSAPLKQGKDVENVPNRQLLTFNSRQGVPDTMFYNNLNLGRENVM